MILDSLGGGMLWCRVVIITLWALRSGVFYWRVVIFTSWALRRSPNEIEKRIDGMSDLTLRILKVIVLPFLIWTLFKP